MNCGIYKIENTINGKKYIGQSSEIKKRMNKVHWGCHALNNSIKKYGKENFKRSIILYCEPEYLEYYEIECIKIFRSHYTEWGYNISWGGDAPMRGRHHSDESNKSNAEKHKRENIPEERIKRMADGSRGNKNASGKRTPKQKQKMSEGHKSKYFCKKNINSSSKYFGVCMKKGRKGNIYWMAFTRINKKQKYLGIFKIEIDAAKAYDNFIIKNNIDRPLNFY